MPKVPEEHRDFGEIWKIYVTNNGIIFQSFTTVLFYKDNQVKVLAHEGDYHFSFYKKENLYISSSRQGLMKYNGQNFESLPNGDFFTGDRRLWTMMRYGNDQFLLGTQNDGLFVYDKDTLRPWENEANRFLKKNQLFSAARISGEYFAFGSIQNGLILVDNKGNILQHINKERGLQNNTILTLFADRGQNLWLGLDNGIDYIEIHSPISYMGEGFRIEGTGYASALYDNRLYLGTNQGLFFNELKQQTPYIEVDDHFELIDNTKGQVWNLSRIDGKLFVGHNKGALVVEGDSARQISNVQGGWNFLRVPGHPGYILQGTYSGLVRLKKVNGRWQFDTRIAGFDESSRIETWDDQGNLWITHGYKGIYRLRLNQSVDSVEQVAVYTEEDGLPSLTGNTVFRLKDQIYASTNQGIYRYFFLPDQFEKDTMYSRLTGNQQVSTLRKDRYGNLWYFSNYSEEIGMIKAPGSPSGFEKIEVLEKLDDQFVPAFEHVNIIDSNNIIIGIINGFAHFDPTISVHDSTMFRTLIREFSFYSNQDTIRYHNLSTQTPRQENIEMTNPRLLRIRFASTFYEDLIHTRYSYYLKGYDQDWSPWISRNTKEYTNLPPGEYTFYIRARNVYGRISKPTEFRFVIPPPWYQTNWAYMGYILITIAFILLASHYLYKKLEKEKKKVEEENREKMRRQREAYEKDQLEMQNKIIQLENEKLQSEIEREETSIRLKNKELNVQAININRKNEILNYLKKEIDRVMRTVNPDAQFQLKMLNRKIDQDLNPREDWEKFEQYFDEVHGDFISRLKEKYPQLSPKDLKLCAYLRMNLSSKEIASLLNITPRGVEIHRYRLRKKLNLSRETNLVEFLMDV
jgi:DNA-binding CsgD family transcriptional regulator